MTKTNLLDTLSGPDDLKKLPAASLSALVDEIRRTISTVVSDNGGHLASNLGVVELTVALHRVFDFKKDRLVWDVGHQCYAHKLLTGRADRFHTLRQAGGLSGFPNPKESPYDLFASGHAGTSLSEALGLVMADRLAGRNDAQTVAVIGDGSLATGMALEALNHAGDVGKGLIVILNDNRMSIARSVGALSNHLNRIRSSPIYNEARRELKNLLDGLPLVGRPVENVLGMFREAVVHWKHGTLFEDLGFRYFGPIDGHDMEVLTTILQQLRHQRFDKPVLVHIFTEKGHGHPHAAGDPARFHGVSPKAVFDDCNELEGNQPPRETFTDVFSRTLVRLAGENQRIVALTAAMPSGTGLDRFASAFPKRYFDVGICEQHAVGMAEGLARGGFRPVAAIYSTFLQRAYDQVFHDACLQELPILFAIDRAGLVGADGPTHHGAFDIAMLRHLPGIVLASPADGPELSAMLELGLAHDRPFAIRYPRASVPEPLENNDLGDLRLGKSRTLRSGTDGALLAYGWMAESALIAAQRLSLEGISLEVVNARFAKPLDTECLNDLLTRQPFIITLEEHAAAGGFGSAVLEYAATLAQPVCPIRVLGLPDRFIAHGERTTLLAECGLDVEGIMEAVKAATTESHYIGTIDDGK